MFNTSLEDVPYFNVEQEFFIIDSDNLQDVKTKLYGYSVQDTGIYEDENLTEVRSKSTRLNSSHVF